MIDTTLDRSTRGLIRSIKRAKIREPLDGQSVGPCHWSKTGWAIVDSDGCCTCKPARKPGVVGSPRGQS